MKNERNPRARSKYAGIDTGQLVIVRDTDGGEDPLAIVYSLVSLLLLIIAVFGFKDFILDANNIPSGSMIPTLKIGDYLFVNKMRYSIRAPFTGLELARLDEPERGDIITFIPPHERERHFVKRVMGLPGDRIAFGKCPPAVSQRLSAPNFWTTVSANSPARQAPTMARNHTWP